METKAFCSWLNRMKLSDSAAAESLGMSRNTIRGYREGTAQIPKHVALACAAISFGLPPAIG